LVLNFIAYSFKGFSASAFTEDSKVIEHPTIIESSTVKNHGTGFDEFVLGKK
jgi:hypothetical protein